jgi:hypothetical protein
LRNQRWYGCCYIINNVKFLTNDYFQYAHDSDDDIFGNKLESKRKRASTVVSQKLRSPLPKPSASQLHATTSSTNTDIAEVPKEILKSVFRVRPSTSSSFPKQPKWTRDPKMVMCNFTRTMAKFMWEGPRCGEIICESSEKREVIEIVCASDSEVGQSGFIGEGSTKRGIYVRTPKVCLSSSLL